MRLDGLEVEEGDGGERMMLTLNCMIAVAKKRLKTGDVGVIELKWCLV